VKSPNDTASWCPDKKRLEELGVRKLPSVQTVKLELTEKLLGLLEALR
jgi:hypothetical protein